MMTEEWKDIEHFEGAYQVSSLCRVRSLLRNRTLIMATSIHSSGYRSVSLRGRLNFIHRLVAKAFVPNPNNYREVNHKDMDKKNNHPDNLEWVTRSQNIRHALRNGAYDKARLRWSKTVRGLNSRRAKLTDVDVIAIREQVRQGGKALLLSYQYNVASGTIYDVIRRRSWKHI